MQTWNTYEERFRTLEEPSGDSERDRKVRDIVRKLISEHNETVRDFRLFRKVVSQLEEREY